MECKKNEKIENEELLDSFPQILDSFGWFQVRSFILLSFPIASVGMFSMSPVFFNIVPPYRCQWSHDNQSMNEDNITVKFDSMCVSRFEVDSNSTNEDNLEKCSNRWIYNTTNGNTVVSQFDLICESAWKRPLTTSTFLLGVTVGSMFGGQLSDRFGRRPTCLSVLLTEGILLEITSFCDNYWIYVCCLFLIGIFHTLSYFCIYTWAQEIGSSADKRALAAFCVNSAYPVGHMLISLVAYLAKDWKWIYRVVGISHVFCLPLMWMVSESPAWTVRRGDKEKSLIILEQIVKINKVNIKKILEKNKQNENNTKIEEKGRKRKLPSKILWQNTTLRRRLVLMCLLWNAVYISYYTLALNSSNLGGNVYLNNVIGAAVDITAAIVMTVTLKKISRKSTLSVVMIFLGFLCIGSPLASKGQTAAGISMAMIGRYFSTTAMMLCVFYPGEIFPTLLRNTSVCISNMSAGAAMILSPFLIFAGEEIDLSIPFYVMGGVSFAAVSLVFLLPDTSKTLLLNTLNDALALNDPKLFSQCKLFPTKREKLHQVREKSGSHTTNPTVEDEPLV